MRNAMLLGCFLIAMSSVLSGCFLGHFRGQGSGFSSDESVAGSDTAEAAHSAESPSVR